MNKKMSRATKALRRAESKKIAAAAELQVLRLRLEGQQGGGSESKPLEQKILQQRELLRSLNGKFNSLGKSVDRFRGRFLADTAEKEMSKLSGRFPVMLLPVRLETIFDDDALLIRIFPDDIHVDQHDESLAAAEVAAFKSFLGDANIADKEVRRTVFNGLAETYSAPRAGWILRRMQEQQDVATEQPDTGSVRASRASGLPDRFVAIGLRKGKKVFVQQGNIVSSTLQLGPDPSADVEPNEQVDPDTLLKDPGLHWLQDFQEAENRGMAIRVGYREHDKQLAERGLDKLVVLGVKGSVDATATVSLIEEIFASHRYATGLGFVEQGTPTNNTETVKSGFVTGSFESAAESVLPSERPVSPGDQSNDEVFAHAMGITDTDTIHQLFGTLENADLREQVDARQMNTALWSSTGGYFLEQMMRPLGDVWKEGSAREMMNELRTHFVNHVRARGPLPAFRVGDQPYGVLTILPLSRWKPENKSEHLFEQRAIGVVNALQKYWRNAEDKVAHLGQTTDPGDDLVAALSIQAIADRFLVHPLLGPGFLKNTALQYGPDGPQTDALGFMINDIRQRVRDVLSDVGVNISTPLLAECIHVLCDYRISSQAAQNDIDNNTESLDPDYIKWLLQAPLAEIQDESGAAPFKQDRGVPLLYLLLRYAVLQELGDASRERLTKINSNLHFVLEPEILGFRAAGNRLGNGTVMDFILSADPESSGRTVGEELLHNIRINQTISTRRWGEFWGALRHLSRLSAENLDELSRETLDLFSSRLDAWSTSFATKRLEKLDRVDQPGRWLGAYGFVENLRQRGSMPSAGYIHAPSLNQAATAAVMYNGYLTHSGEDQEALAIELDSNQVRHAEILADGLRHGVSLSELLGYRFERHLQENELQVHVYPFRLAFPGIGALHDEPEADDELPPEARVLDGLALVRAFNASGYGSVLNKIADVLPGDVPPSSGSVANTIRDGLKQLGKHLDALGDTMMVESVHQMLQGNPERSGAALASMSGSGIAPPELQAMKTPRTGVAISHRLTALWSVTSAPPTATPLERLLPGISHWVQRWLGNLNNVVLGFEAQKLGSGVFQVSLADLGLTAINLVFSTTNAGRDEALLTQKIHRHVAQQLGGPQEASSVVWDLEHAPSPRNDLLSWQEFSPVLAAVRNVLGAGRMLDARDLFASDDNMPGSMWDASGALTVLKETHLSLGLLIRDVDAAITNLQNAAVNSTRESIAMTEILWRAVDFRIEQAIPTDSLDSSGLLQQAQMVLALAIGRIKSYQTAVADGIPSVVDIKQRSMVINAVTALMADGLPVVLPVVLEKEALDELTANWDNAVSTSLQVGDATSSDRWVSDIAAVRDRVSLYQELRTQFGVSYVAPPLSLSVCQLPLRQGDRWIALPQQSDVNEVKTSVVAELVDSLQNLRETGIAGWTIDEWQDLIPGTQETTGIGFHYDSPGSRAPNTILMAVPPDPNKNWSLDDLLETVLETTQLMKQRAVASNQIDGLGQLLPALIIPENDSGETASVDLKRARPAN